MIDLPDFDALWNFSDPAATEAQFRAILPRAEAADSTSYLAQLLTQIARTQGLQRQSDAAHATLDQVEAMLSDDLPVARIRYLLERGRAHNGLPRPYAPDDPQSAQARPFFLQAWERANAANEDYYAIDAAHMMAIVEPPDQALEWNLRALAVAEQSTDDKARNWLGSLYNNIGWTYFDAGEHAKALDLFEKALVFRTEQGDPENIRIARWCVGKALRHLDRLDEALGIQRALHETADAPDGYVYEELAECLHALGRSDEATEFFAKAHGALAADEWFAENFPERLQRLKDLGQ